MYYIVLLQYLFLYIYVILLFICIVQPKALYFADLLINLLACLILLHCLYFFFAKLRRSHMGGYKSEKIVSVFRVL